MCLRQLLHNGLFEPFAAHDWAVCFQHDVAFLAPGHNVWTRQPGVKLPLPNVDRATSAFAVLGFELFDIGLQFVEMVHAVVTDAKGTYFPGLLGLDESAPGAETTFPSAVRGVNQVAE